ncbi:MAG: 30S ribosome-binding factor RbfA [Acidimicrobiales bacterium]
MTRRRAAGRRDFPRAVRVGELCREILAEELERLDDDRLQLVTITHVRVDPDLRHAVVDFASLGQGEEAAAVALVRNRARLQAAIARQARLKRTPELRFRVDEAIRTGARVDELLREHPPPPHDAPPA